VLSGIPELNKSDIGETFVPSVYRFTRNNEEREMLKLGLVKPNSYARPFAMPPGVPRDRVRAVEAAFLKTLKDPEFVAEAEKTRNDLESDLRDHPAQHDRRRPVHANRAQRKAQADPCAEGLSREPVVVSESVAFPDRLR
jgi:hypothetical protein